MKKTLTLTLTLALAVIVFAQDKTVVDTIFNRAAYEDTFAFGADISWLSQQESWGTYYNNRAGKKTDLMQILQEEQGINAVRFRVWVNPSGGWSGKNDVIALCKRAHARGMKIMISFHYSDTWADSSNQGIPGQWTDHSAEALAKNVYDHTYDVLSSLKKLGIVPRWVGIGNETKYGMLYDVGKTKSTEGYKNFTLFINNAYKAIKDVDSTMLAMIHLPNAHDLSTAKSMFTNLNKYGANYDVIGLSAYPRWSHLDVTTDANIKSTINTYMTTFKSLKSTFGKPVMVVETGHYCDAPLDGNRFLAEFMKAIIDDGELGCFYWEPEAFENSGYNLGAWNSATHQATIAMDAFKGLKHTKVDKYMTLLLRNPVDTLIAQSGEEVEMKVYAKSSNSVTHIAGVDFYLNGDLASTQTIPESGAYYVFRNPDLTRGAYQFYATAFDNQQHSQNTDTVSFVVGPAVVFQEGAIGVDEMTDGVVESTNKGYTGSGYLAFQPVKTACASWAVDFPVAGDYTILFRYASDVKKMTKIYPSDQSTSYAISTFPATPSLRDWSILSKKLTVDAPGTRRIRLQAFNANGLPNIDYMAIISPEGVDDVTAVDATGIEEASIPVMGNGLGVMDSYNLAGQKVASDYQGIVIRNGQKTYSR